MPSLFPNPLNNFCEYTCKYSECIEVGFLSPVTWRQHFKFHFGVSPAGWRKTFRGMA
ncbi:hypothetical protein AC26_0420 [Escherichia coli 1-176-05_S3_C2]|nr:hypothetical protein AC26_0420 [Escherichia coli 1-176-05_S3_C2]